MILQIAEPWYKASARILFEYLAIAACFAMAYHSHPVFWLPICWLMGTRIHALGILGHLATHRYLFKYRPFNLLSQRMAFLPMFIDADVYKKFHYAHHMRLSVRGEDPETKFVDRFIDRWTAYRVKDTVLDLVGLHADESLMLMEHFISMKSLMLGATFWLVLFLCFGPTMLLWFVATGTGALASHRLRAWTEHDHLFRPGITLRTQRPALWRRMLYLPNRTWLHYEHHNFPELRV